MRIAYRHVEELLSSGICSADNFTANAGSGGDTFAADEIASVKYPRSKIVIGADGTNDGDVSSANPMPVTGTITAVTSITNAVTVNAHAVTNAGTFAVQEDGAALTALQLIDDAVYTDGTGTPSKGIAVMGSDGSNPQLISVDTSGNVQVDLVTADVTNAGTFAVQVDGSALTALQLIDDVVVVDDAAYTAASGKGVPLMAFATADTVDSGDIGAVAMDTSRNLKVSIEVDNAGIGGGTQYTEDAAAAADPVGNATILVRADTPGAVTGTDGDNVAQRGTNFGAGYVQVVDSVGNFVDKFGGDVDVFGRSSVSDANNDIDIQFYKGAPSTLIQVTTANSATAAANAGGALFSSSTNANGSVQGVTTQITSYRSGSEIYCMFTAAFTAGIANSYMRIGLYDANDGFFIGYEGTSFGVTYRSNTSDTTVAKASFSEDTLAAAAGSRFTRAGTAEAIDLTKLNVYRIRFGWLGSAPVYWEVMAPDGHWVCFHKTLFPNLQATPSIQNPDLPMTLDITKTAAAATDITIQTDCWGAGTSVGSRAAQEDEYAFQTTATLNNGADYTTSVLALSPEFSQVQTSVLASHNGSIDIYWYSDPAGADQVRLLTIPYTASDGFQMFSAPAFTPFVKYKFTNNSGSNQTDFHFDTKFLRRPVNPQLLRVDGPVVGGMVAAVSRALITASNGSNYVNVGATAGGNLKVSLEELSNGVDVGNGTVGSETLRVTIASDTTGVLSVDDNSGSLTVDNAGTFAVQEDGAALTALQLIDDPVFADDAAFTIGTSKVMVAGGVVDDASTDSADEGDAAAIRLTTDRKVTVHPQPHTTGGLTTARSLDLDETEEEIKSTAGMVYGWTITNFATSTRHVKFYNATAATVVVGTTTPLFTVSIPGNSSDDTLLSMMSTHGIEFSTAITWAATTGLADADTGAPAANDVSGTVWYK